MGAALTYARRYALFTLVGIAGEDDIDAPDLKAPTPPASASANPAPDWHGRLNGGQTNPSRGGTKVISNPATQVLGAEASGTLRDQLLAELKAVASSDDAAVWAHRILGVPCSDGLNQAVSTHIQHRTTARTKPETCPAPSGNPSRRLSIPPQSLRVAFCVSPICPTTRLTASADMKRPFGAKPARSFLHSMSWIAADHGIEGAVSVSVVGKNCRFTIPRLVSLRRIQTLLDQCL
jgi:ERF superfamily